MAKALGSLVLRGVLGVMSIVATAVVTVFVQRYLNTTPGAPPSSVPSSTSPAAQPGEPAAVNETQVDSPDSPDSSASPAESETGRSTDAASEEQGDLKTRIMEQFWDKLDR